MISHNNLVAKGGFWEKERRTKKKHLLLEFQFYCYSTLDRVTTFLLPKYSRLADNPPNGE